MSIFGSILSKIFNMGAPGAVERPGPTPAGTKSTAAGAATQAKQAAPVDVEKVLTDLAAKKGGGGNWRTSIVDLLKMLDLDSSLSARKELAEELKVHAGPHGTAEQNMALQKAVWAKLADNGGKVPASLKD